MSHVTIEPEDMAKAIQQNQLALTQATVFAYERENAKLIDLLQRVKAGSPPELLNEIEAAIGTDGD